MEKENLKLILNEEKLKKSLQKRSFQTNPIVKKLILFANKNLKEKFSIKDLFK